MQTFVIVKSFVLRQFLSELNGFAILKVKDYREEGRS